MTTFTPTNAADALEAILWAVSEEAPVEIVGAGSKRTIGRPAQTAHAIDLSRLAGITLYEPEELVLSARAGTPIAEIEATLAARGQELAFEPMDTGPLLGRECGAGTIGGTLSANLAGPRRLKAGSARDHILGIAAVSGRGEAFKAGGRVVKNVTGYDLSKVMAGAWGTLALLTDVTFKVLPRAETETTLLLRGLDDEAATIAMAAAMGSSAEVSGAAHLPERVTARVVGGTLGEAPATAIRVEGFGPSVAARIASLRSLFAAYALEELEVELSRALWRDLRDAVPFADQSDRPVWRVSTAPSEGWKIVAAMRMGAAVDAFYDWQGGLVWLRMDGDPEADALRRLTRHHGGHATLIRANAALRAATPVFEPQAPALAALSARLKEQFDPKAILNPGRMGHQPSQGR